jgi:hypothetical protein
MSVVGRIRDIRDGHEDGIHEILNAAPRPANEPDDTLERILEFAEEGIYNGPEGCKMILRLLDVIRLLRKPPKWDARRECLAQAAYPGGDPMEPTYCPGFGSSNSET